MKKFFNLLILTTIILNLIGCSTNRISDDAVDINSNVEYVKEMPSLNDVDDINLNIEGTLQTLTNPIYIDKNRYYIPLTEVVKENKGNIKVDNNKISIDMFESHISVNADSGIWDNGSIKDKLKQVITIKNDNVYITLIDFANMFQMKTRWYGDTKTIKLYKDRDMKDVKEYKKPGKQTGAIRFEDVYVSGNPIDSKYLEVIRIMGRYLSLKGVPYHVSWIPRVVKPAENLDIDPSKENSFLLAELIYTLDYVQYNKGVIGLHGYTHQRDGEATGIGLEFGEKYPSVSELRERVEESLKIADDLKIPVKFFEAPHYNITTEQNMALEDYFMYIFNNYEFSNNLNAQTAPIKSPKGKGVYVPTPLSYVREDGVLEMENKIKELDKKSFAGLFYHPFLEVQIVDLLEDEDGYPSYKYKEPSILASVIDALEKKRINIIPITSVN